MAGTEPLEQLVITAVDSSPFLTRARCEHRTLRTTLQPVARPNGARDPPGRAGRAGIAEAAGHSCTAHVERARSLAASDVAEGERMNQPVAR